MTQSALPTTTVAGRKPRRSGGRSSLIDEGTPGEPASHELPQLYTPAEAANLLTVGESWLRRQAGQRRIPCTYLGKHLRFSAADLRAIVAAGSRTPRRRNTRCTD